MNKRLQKKKFLNGTALGLSLHGHLNNLTMKSISLLLRGILILLIFIFVKSEASILHVPGDYPTIQQAINAARNGDTVLADAGEYFENINFKGKAITVAGNYLLTLNPADILNTVINGSNPVNPDTASCVLFINGEDSTSELQGGGSRFWSSAAQVTNNILWGNTADSNPQIQGGYISTITYCDIEGGWTGEGNIDADPLFFNTNFILDAGSLCIDAGNPAAAFNDPEDLGNPGNAAWPSFGTVRNDMGAYGGPWRMVLADIQVSREDYLMDEFPLIVLYPNPASSVINLRLPELISRGEVLIHDARGALWVTKTATPGTKTLTLDVSPLPAGLYSITIPGNRTHPDKFVICR